MEELERRISREMLSQSSRIAYRLHKVRGERLPYYMLFQSKKHRLIQLRNELFYQRRVTLKISYAELLNRRDY